MTNLIERQRDDKRSYAGFNPARADDVRLFQAILDDNHVTQGFRNQDIRDRLYPAATTHAADKRRHSHAIGRLFKRLHVRRLVAKIPRTRRWRVTELGRSLLGKAIALYTCHWPQLVAQAAT